MSPIKLLPVRKGFFQSFISSFSLTVNLIIINVLFFILFYLASILSNLLFGTSLINYLAVQANSLFLQGYVWTLLTSMFLHAGLFHLIVNMFSLYFLGSFLEMIIGKKRFFWFYISSGIFAALFFAILAFLFGNGLLGARIFGSPETFAVGASGTIFAIAGLLAVLTPKNRVYLLIGPLFAIIFESILVHFFANSSWISFMDILVTIYIFISIFGLLTNLRGTKLALPVELPFWLLPFVAIIPLVVIGLFIDLPIGNSAHLGGFIFGVFYGFYLRYKYKSKTQRIAEYFSKK